MNQQDHTTRTIELLSRPETFSALRTAKDVLDWKHYALQELRACKEADQLQFASSQTLSKDTRQTISGLLLGAMELAVPVLWRGEMRQAAINGADYFIGHGYRSETINPSIQLWVFDSDLTSPAVLGSQYKHLSLDAILITDSAQQAWGIQIWRPSLYSIPLAAIERMFHHFEKYGVPPKDLSPVICPLRLPKKAKGKAEAAVIAMLEFMDLELASLAPLRLPRPDRRRLAKAHQKEPDVRVVILRRERQKVVKTIEQQVEWSCQWVVAGHWRNQWYPSADVHRPIFIEPYIKGPENKPIKKGVNKVLMVKR
jgi:hypothetical protein